MSFDDPEYAEVFFDLHHDLPREGPGDDVSTEHALSFVSPLPDEPRVLDIGCGPGMQTLALAEAMPSATITALDFYPRYVERLAAAVQSRGLDDRVNVIQGDMTALDFEHESFDLLWCEGAIYIMGVTRALTAWRPLLASGGFVAFTEAVWISADPPHEVVQFWNNEYPNIADIAANRGRIRAAGFDTRHDFVLPPASWWDHYYGPLQTRVEQLTDQYAGNAKATDVLAEAQREIDIFRQYSRYYSYAFFVAEKPRG